MKIKSATSIVFTILVAFCVIFQTNSVITAKELDNDVYDRVFLGAISDLAQDNYQGEIEINAEKELLYDINLQAFGYIYVFVVNGESGYAIVINQTSIQATEIYFDAKSPYQSNDLKIYISNMHYLYYNVDSQIYRWTDSNATIDDLTLQQLKSVALYAGGNITSSTTTVHYKTKTEKDYAQAKRYPGECEVGGLSNACVAIASGNIVQYWDRYCINLIPDFTPGTSLGNMYIYKESPQTHAIVTTELYGKMHTANNEGITISQWKAGLTAYCNNYTVTYTSCMSNGNFVYGTAKQQLELNQPLMLFVDMFSASEIYDKEKSDVINSIVGNGSHAMVAFGYREITYTLQNNITQNDIYLAVATGLSNLRRGYSNIKNMTIDDAYAVNIL